MKFSTREFEFSHGKKPRGTGTWAFATVAAPAPGSPAIFWHNGSFAEAKKAAREHFKGATVVHVQP